MGNIMIRLDSQFLKFQTFERVVRLRDYSTETLTLDVDYYPLSAIRRDYRFQLISSNEQTSLYLSNFLQRGFYTKEKVEFLMPPILIDNPVLTEFPTTDEFVLSSTTGQNNVSSGAIQAYVRQNSTETANGRTHPDDLFTAGRVFQFTKRDDNDELIDKTIYTITGQLDERSNRARQIEFFPSIKDDFIVEDGRHIISNTEIYYTGVITAYQQTRASNQFGISYFNISMDGATV